MKANRAQEAAFWFERAVQLGTPAVREAVLRIADLPSSPAGLAELAMRLRSPNNSSTCKTAHRAAGTYP